MPRPERLVLALHAGRVGAWWWNRGTDEVGWDEQLAELFGIRTDDFEGTFAGWLSRIDPRDRGTVMDVVNHGVETRQPFRFDHRCVWPDGSVHWLEGVGEVVVGPTGEVTGAVGLAFDVDERHHELDERARLLAFEQRARLRAEYLARVHEVLATSLDPTDILERVTAAAVPELGDWCTAVLSIDRPRDDPLIVAAHHDPALRDWTREVRARFPYDPDAPFGAAVVIRTGRPEVLTGLSAFRAPAPEQDVLDRADVESVLTVPIVGPLGVLGALQLIRGRSREAFGEADMELVDELAGRCGAALHTAILFARQATTRSALDTLQRVSGGLAAAVLRRDVADAIIGHGVAGLRADGAVLVLLDDTGMRLVGSEGVSEGLVAALLHGLGGRVPETVTFTDHDDDGVVRRVVVTPLRLRGAAMGALLFVFHAPRDFADVEVSMLVTLAARCAGALERAALYERERDTALVLQRRLLPAVAQVPEWLDVAAHYEPASGRQIGGDWFQLVDAGPGRVVAVVGDAVGHGIASAAAMGQLRASIATAVSSTVDPFAALRIVDRFAAQGADTVGASVSFALIQEDGLLRYASAGHPPAILVPAGGRPQLLPDGRLPLLGVGHRVGTSGVEGRATLGRGDTLVMFSDGLVERRGESIDDGTARLVDHLHRLIALPPAELGGELIDALHASEAGDDVALLVVRRR